MKKKGFYVLKREEQHWPKNCTLKLFRNHLHEVLSLYTWLCTSSIIYLFDVFKWWFSNFNVLPTCLFIFPKREKSKLLDPLLGISGVRSNSGISSEFPGEAGHGVSSWTPRSNLLFTYLYSLTFVLHFSLSSSFQFIPWLRQKTVQHSVCDGNWN